MAHHAVGDHWRDRRFAAHGDAVHIHGPVGCIKSWWRTHQNADCCVEQDFTEIDKGKAPYQAIIDGATSKVRPVCMVVFTTVLGMIPLLKDPFFGAMAAGLMFGPAFATSLCLIVTPVLYAIFYGVREPVLQTHSAD